MPPDKDWIDLLSALTTPIIAAIGIYIAYQQRAINKNRLKHELFDKRFHVYERIGAFIAEILTSGRVQDGADYTFLSDTKSVFLLFDADIKAFTDEIYKKSITLHCLDAELESTTGDERKTNLKKQSEIKEWYLNQLNTYEGKFIKYLKLEH